MSRYVISLINLLFHTSYPCWFYILPLQYYFIRPYKLFNFQASLLRACHFLLLSFQFLSMFFLKQTNLRRPFWVYREHLHYFFYSTFQEQVCIHRLLLFSLIEVHSCCMPMFACMCAFMYSFFFWVANFWKPFS